MNICECMASWTTIKLVPSFRESCDIDWVILLARACYLRQHIRINLSEIRVAWDCVYVLRRRLLCLCSFEGNWGTTSHCFYIITLLQQIFQRHIAAHHNGSHALLLIPKNFPKNWAMQQNNPF